MTWVSIVFNHFYGRKSTRKSCRLLGCVFYRLAGRRSASGGKTIVAWISIVFGHRDGREDTRTRR
jgi:hypothetical protein